jgi:predicted aldo/keto reductase-like oxidoreductase
MREHRLDRREFMRQSATAIGAALVAPVAAAAAPPRRATDLVPLGQTGVRMARLGIGTGSNGGDVQRGLGQEAFTRLLRHAVDHGVTYIDTADNYRIHEMVGAAIKGLPRERLFIQTKMPWDRPPFPDKPREALDRYRRELGVEYLDSLLLHCAVTHTWPHDLRRMMDVFDEAKRQQIIRLKGVSCHGMPALTAATGVDWVDVHLVRINHQGHHMDGADGTWAEKGNQRAAMEQIRAMHDRGRGIIGMKLVGNGDFTSADDRERALQFALTCGCVDAVVMGFKSPAEIDEAIARMDRILATA